MKNTNKRNTIITTALCISVLLTYLLFQAKSNLKTISTEQNFTASDAKKNVNTNIRTLLSDLSSPWGLEVLPNGNLLISEKKSGQVIYFDPKTKQRHTISNVPKSIHWGQGGLMAIKAHPNFSNNKLIYFSMAREIEKGQVALQVARAKFENQTFSNSTILFTAHPANDTKQHFGGALAFDKNNYLYITSGERRQRKLIQKLDNHLGKIIRLHDDGSIPKDNPFTSSNTITQSIYTLGHRNAQGLAFSADKTTLWSVEHGPRGGDEINKIIAGKNYGWPVISYGVEYISRRPIGVGTHQAGMEQPLHVYTPSIAPSSLMLYTGDAFAQWENTLFIGALAKRHLNHITITGDSFTETRLLKNLDERIRNVAQAKNGFIYVITDSGKLLEISKEK